MTDSAMASIPASRTITAQILRLQRPTTAGKRARTMPKVKLQAQSRCAARAWTRGRPTASHSTAVVAATVPPTAAPEPAFLTQADGTVSGPVAEAAMQLAADTGAAQRAAHERNRGYTWLTHPCPYNPFRNRADEDSWYVPPTMEQRQAAQELGLPLYGILL